MDNTFRAEIKKELISKRPGLSCSSLKTYTNLLNSLSLKMEAKQSISFFSEDPTDIIKFVQKNYVSEHSKKTVFSALYVLTEILDYRIKMYDHLKVVTEHYKTHELSENQKKNRITMNEVIVKVNEVRQKLKLNPSISNHQDFLIAALQSGIYCPPLRNELASVKLTNYDPLTSNYYTPGVLCFNNFKTCKTYGTNTLIIPLSLRKVFDKYISLIGDQEYLFVNGNNKPFSQDGGFSLKINSLFGKGIGCSALRSIYVSNLYKHNVPQEKMEETAKAMGHSVGVAMGVYFKKQI